MRPILPLLAMAVLCFGNVAQAVPVTLELAGGSDGGFSFPRIHNASQDPTTLETNRGEVTFYRDGVGPAVSVVLPLTAEATSTSLTFTGGVLRLGDGAALPDFVITGGSVSFAGLAPNTFAGTLETTDYGTFSFLQRRWAPGASLYPPNSYQPFGEPDGFVSLWANNWDSAAVPPAGERWGVDVVFRFPAIPEPATALLLGVGLLVIADCRATRRRRPATKPR
jgi:hypothetical protein